MGSAARKQASTMPYDELVAECKRFRHEHEKAEARFFLFLIVVEQQHESVWRDAGHGTYDSFLRSNDLCITDRYRLFKLGTEKVGLEKAAEYGVPLVIAAGRASEQSVAHLGERAQAFLEVHKTAPSEQVVQNWVSEEKGREAAEGEAKPRRILLQASELMRLRTENAKLKADLAAAKKRIVDLEGELAKTSSKR